MAAKKKPSLRELAGSPLSGFRHDRIPVPEWNGVEVMVREHSAGEWQHYRQLLGVPDEPPKGEGHEPPENEESAQTRADPALPDNRLNAELLAPVLLDTDGHRVFLEEHIGELAEVFGPVHMRLLNRAIELGGLTHQGVDDTKKG